MRASTKPSICDPRHRRPRKALSCWLGMAALALAGPLIACYGPDYWSIHFRGDRPDFFRMPQPWRGAPEEVRARPPRLDDPGDREGQAEAELVKKALRCEKAGQYRQAISTWTRVQQRRINANRWEEDDWLAPPPQIQGLDDRLAALRSWRGPRDTRALRLYLRARDLVNADKDDKALSLLSQLTHGPYRTRAEYLKASLRYYEDTPEAAAAAFRAFLKQHPRDPLALYMLGRCWLRPILEEEEEAEQPPSPAQLLRAGTAPQLTAGQPVRSHHLARSVRAHYQRQALSAYEACAAVEPHGSLAEDARGKVAACLFREGDYASALIRYCAQLAALPPGRDNHYAFLSARDCLKRMSLTDHRVFQSRTLSRPELASVYLDLHLYYGRPGARADYNLGQFALAVLRRRPAAPLSGRLLACLAVIEDRLGRWPNAIRLADAAIARCGPGVYRDQARWQRALSLRHLGRRRDALADYEHLAVGAVAGNIRRGAHEAAAILSEELGDLPNAIRHYFALEYRADYGYLVDCVASPDDLRAFLRRFPDHPRANLIRYEIGFRQLRTGQYDVAAQTFASLGPWLEVAEKAYDCETARGKPRWPPLRLARFLADSVRREAVAPTPAEKARIAYERAQLLFHQRYQAFYNGALWKGEREFTLDIEGPNNFYGGMERLSAQEQRIFDRYQAEHNPLSQAVQIFERIARDYPHTPEAPKSLYSAALCYSLPAHLDRYSASHAADNSARASALYRRLQRDYPHHPLAVAAARYGGRLPARTPPPAPVPRGKHP